MFRNFSVILFYLVLGACSSKKVMEYNQIDSKQISEEFDQMVKIEELPKEKAPVQVKQRKDIVKEQITKTPDKKPPQKDAKSDTKDATSKKSGKESKGAKVDKSKDKKLRGKKVVEVKDEKPKKHLPDLENSDGFDGRRPMVDPIGVGEKVVMSVTYFNMAAGDIIFEAKPFVTVNNRKSYHFKITLKSSKVFNYFYAVDDVAETFMDYETLTPSTFKIKVRHSTEVKDIRSFFDFNENRATYWRKQVKKDGEEKTKKMEWEIDPYTQNVISAFFYLRNFTLVPGKDLAFRVADAGKNMIFTGKVIKKEKLTTEIGTLDTVLVRPKIEIEGAFKQMGDIDIWLTDDDRKFPVRIDAKIKIGTLVFKVKEIHP